MAKRLVRFAFARIQDEVQNRMGIVPRPAGNIVKSTRGGESLQQLYGNKEEALDLVDAYIQDTSTDVQSTSKDRRLGCFTTQSLLYAPQVRHIYRRRICRGFIP